MMTRPDNTVAVRVLTRRNRVVDGGVAAVLLLATAFTVPLSSSALGTPIPDLRIVVVWAAGVTLPLAFRRSAPTIVAPIVELFFIGGQAMDIPEAVVSQIAPFLALYTLGAWSPHRRRAAVVRATLCVVLALWFLLAISLSRIDPEAAPASVVLSALATGLYLAAAIIFGSAGWRSAMRREGLERRTVELQGERERTALQAAALERTRIARELHDVVAHHVSVMGVQAGAARRVLTLRPNDITPALDALVGIEASSRKAVEELGRTVISLRDFDEAEVLPTLAPSTRGIDQVEYLVGETRALGIPVEYTVEGDTSTVSPSAAFVVHRIVQESLTNIRKHAGLGTRALVALRIHDSFLELTITNSGGDQPERAHGTGMGQLGMRERAAAVGGEVEMGPTDDGYRVRVVLPVVK